MPLFMYMYVECGGKMHLREGEFSRAHTDFFEAFKNYDESGSPRQVIRIHHVCVHDITTVLSCQCVDQSYCSTCTCI